MGLSTFQGGKSSNRLKLVFISIYDFGTCRDMMEINGNMDTPDV